MAEATSTNADEAPSDAPAAAAAAPEAAPAAAAPVGADNFDHSVQDARQPQVLGENTNLANTPVAAPTAGSKPRAAPKGSRIPMSRKSLMPSQLHEQPATAPPPPPPPPPPLPPAPPAPMPSASPMAALIVTPSEPPSSARVLPASARGSSRPSVGGHPSSVPSLGGSPRRTSSSSAAPPPPRSPASVDARPRSARGLAAAPAEPTPCLHSPLKSVRRSTRAGRESILSEPMSTPSLGGSPPKSVGRGLLVRRGAHTAPPSTRLSSSADEPTPELDGSPTSSRRREGRLSSVPFGSSSRDHGERLELASPSTPTLRSPPKSVGKLGGGLKSRLSLPGSASKSQ